MTKQEKLNYSTKKPVAVCSICGCFGVEILDIIYDINDYIVYRFTGENNIKDIHKSKINYGLNISSFKTSAGYSIRLNDCIRV